MAVEKEGHLLGTCLCDIDNEYLAKNLIKINNNTIKFKDNKLNIGILSKNKSVGITHDIYVYWPVSEEPTLKPKCNLIVRSIPYSKYDLRQDWGIEYKEYNGILEDPFAIIPQMERKSMIIITRNGEFFKSLDGTKYTLEDAKHIIDKYLKNNYPVDWNSSNWKEKLIGKRISYLGFPAIIRKVDDTRIWFDFYGESKFNCIVRDMWNCQVSDEAPIPHAMYDLINYPLINEYGNYTPICLLDPIKYGSILDTGTVIYPTDLMAVVK